MDRILARNAAKKMRRFLKEIDELIAAIERDARNRVLEEFDRKHFVGVVGLDVRR